MDEIDRKFAKKEEESYLDPDKGFANFVPGGAEEKRKALEIKDAVNGFEGTHEFLAPGARRGGPLSRGRAPRGRPSF